MSLQETREAERKALVSAYQRTFATEDGLKVIADLKKIVHYSRSHFTGGPIESNMLIFDEARRGLVLGIIAKIEADLEIPKPQTAITEEPAND